MTQVLFDAPGPKARRRNLLLTVVTGVVILAILAWMIATLAAQGLFSYERWDIFQDPIVWQGLAILRLSDHAAVRVPVTVLLEFLRGMPVLLMMFFILILFAVEAYTAVVAGLALYNGAIIGEALRAGVRALPRGQREAGLSLGLTKLRTRLLIEFPQAFRSMTPIIVAQLVVLLKDSSLGYIVGLQELVRYQRLSAEFFGYSQYALSFFLITLAMFLVVNLSLSWLARRLARRGFGHGGRGGRGVPAVQAVVDPESAVRLDEAVADREPRDMR
jgi:glutamate transport system permease protein